MRRPENTAGVDGDYVVLNCRPGVGAITRSWVEYASNETGLTIFRNETRGSAPGIYDLLNPDEGDYNLNISLDQTSGGQYCCIVEMPYLVQACAHVTALCELFELRFSLRGAFRSLRDHFSFAR